jgi:hypothetical protein
MMTPVHVTYEFTADSYEMIKAGTAMWEPQQSTSVDWLDAAHEISYCQRGNIINLRLISVDTEDMEGFRAYCARLKPAPVTF